MYTIPGWTNASVINNNAVQIATATYGGTYSDNGNGLNSTNPPSADNADNSGAGLGISAGWGDDAIITQVSKTELPVGKYTFTYNVYNANTDNTSIAVNFTGVKLADGTTVYGSKKTATVNTWESESVTFTISESQSVTFSIGFTTSTGGSANGAKLYVDNLKLTYEAIVVKDNLKSAIDNAISANTILNNSDLTTAIATAQATYDNASATQDDVNSAVTTLNAAVETAKKSIANNTNITSLFVTNNSFETGDLTGWDANSANDTGVKPNSNGTYTTTGVDGSYLFNTWGGNAEKYVRQTLTNLPEGFYSVSAFIASDAGVSIDLIAGDTKTSVSASSDGKGSFVTGTTGKVYVADGGSLLIGATSTNWYKVDNFQLTYYTVADNGASSEDYTSLSNAITAAEDYTLGFAAGEYAPYNNVDAIKALAAAKAINTEITNAKSDVTAATEALTNATWTANTADVDIVYNSNFATVEDGANYPKGWTRTNGWGQMRTDADKNSTSNGTAYYNQPGSLVYGDRTGYTMPLKANTGYILTFKYASHENNSNKSMTASVLNSSNEGLAATTYDGNGTVGTAGNSFVTRTTYFTTGTAGDYVLTLANSGNTWITDVSIVEAVELTESATEAPKATTEATNVYLNRTFKAGWNSVVLPFATTAEALGADEAAEYKGTDGNTIKFETTTTLAANTPYLVHFAADQTEAKVINGVKIEPTTEPKVSDSQYDFVGTYTANPTIAKGDYIVVSGGIQKAAGGNALKAFRAYFKANTEAAGAKSMVISIDGNAVSTGINGVSAETVSDGNVYNVAGQKVSSSYKGLVIKNGKKYLRK